MNRARRRTLLLAMLGAGATASIACSALLDIPDRTEAVFEGGPGIDGSLEADTQDGATNDGAGDTANADAGSNDGASADADAGPCVNEPCVIAAALARPYAIAVDDMKVYWTSLRGNDAGGVFACPKQGCDAVPPEAIATGQTEPGSIALDPTPSVMWGTSTKVVHSGTLANPLPLVVSATESQTAAILYEGTYAYWANAGGNDALVRCITFQPCDNPGLRRVLTTGTATDLIRRGTTLVFATTSAVKKVDADGGLAVSVAPSAAYKLALSGDLLLWTNYATGGAGAVSACTLTAGNVCSGTAVIAPAQGRPAGIAADARRVYWVGFEDGALRSCLLPGCAGGPRTLASNLKNPYGIALDADWIYVTASDYTADAGTTGGSVLRMAKPLD